MCIYTDRIAPLMIDRAMRSDMLLPIRQRVVGDAEGRVLEIGIGSGLNLPLYGHQARAIVGLDPSLLLLRRAQQRSHDLALPVQLLAGTAERIPLATASIDSIVMMFVACSIPAVEIALGEMRRVIKPSGRLLFAEHGRAPEASAALWQDRITPLWRRLQAGCHLNRKTDDLIGAAGFRIDRLQTGYAPGPKILSYVYEGSAVPI